MSEHADKITQIGSLVTVEEVFLQVEGFEDEIGVFLVQPVFAKERVITCGNVGPGGIEDSQLVHAAGSLDRRKKVGEKLFVALAVENQHRDAVLVTRRTDDPEDILGDDVLEQSGLARTGRTEHHRLHDARRIGPEPRLAVDVITEHDRVLVVRRCDGLPIFGLADK